MTNPDYTAMLFIIDESGSMQSIYKDMNGGIATLLKEQTELPGKLTVDVAYFDGEFRYPSKLSSPSEVTINIVPKGVTAMYDAIVQASGIFGASLEAMPEDERPATVLVVIVTDGHENASQESTSEHVKDLITAQQDTYDWNYVFLGANQDAVLSGASLGLRAGSSLTYTANTGGVVAASALLSNYTSLTRSGVKASF